MKIRLVLAVICVASMAGTALAQQQPATPQPPSVPGRGVAAPVVVVSPPPPRPPAAVVRGQPINIKVEVTITDQNSGAPPRRKTVTIVTGDMLTGYIRTTASYSGIGPVPLNVDAQPTILPGGKIRTDINLQYTLPASALAQPSQASPPAGSTSGNLLQTTITETLKLLLENGQPLVVAQSADPVGDRQVTVEIKATILK